MLSRDVSKTFFTRPRLLFQDQDQDLTTFPRPRPRPVSDNLPKDSYKQCTWLNKVM